MCTVKDELSVHAHTRWRLIRLLRGIWRSRDCRWIAAHEKGVAEVVLGAFSRATNGAEFEISRITQRHCINRPFRGVEGSRGDLEVEEQALLVSDRKRGGADQEFI